MHRRVFLSVGFFITWHSRLWKAENVVTRCACLPTTFPLLLKLKLKLSHDTPSKRLRREKVQLLLILSVNLGTRWGEWLASRPGRALAPRKGPPVPIVQEAGWAPEPVWTQRLEEKSFVPAGDQTPIARSSSP